MFAPINRQSRAPLHPQIPTKSNLDPELIDPTFIMAGNCASQAERRKTFSEDMNQAALTILIVSHQGEFGEAISSLVQEMSHLPVLALGRESAYALSPARQIAGVILDSELPRGEAVRIAKELRSAIPGAFIIFIFPEHDEQREFEFVAAGADACMAIAVDPKLMKARIGSLLERFAPLRAPEPQRQQIRRIAGLEIDLGYHLLKADDRTVTLTPTESRLLEVLTRTPGKPVTNDAIAHSLWGWDSDVCHEHIRFHISRVRTKLTSLHCSPEMIRTVRGTGYAFSPARTQ